MSQIEIDWISYSDMDKEYRINKIFKFSNVYPALYIKQLGIDKDFKGQGLGYYIIFYCLGLGQILSKSIGYVFFDYANDKRIS